MPLSASNLNVGDQYEEVVVDDLTRTQLIQYAGASGDYNPLHTDDLYSKEVAGYPGVFAGREIWARQERRLAGGQAHRLVVPAQLGLGPGRRQTRRSEPPWAPRAVDRRAAGCWRCAIIIRAARRAWANNRRPRSRSRRCGRRPRPWR